MGILRATAGGAGITGAGSAPGGAACGAKPTGLTEALPAATGATASAPPVAARNFLRLREREPGFFGMSGPPPVRLSGQKYTLIIPPADMLRPSRKYWGIT